MSPGKGGTHFNMKISLPSRYFFRIYIYIYIYVGFVKSKLHYFCGLSSFSLTPWPTLWKVLFHERSVFPANDVGSGSGLSILTCWMNGWTLNIWEAWKSYKKRGSTQQLSVPGTQMTPVLIEFWACKIGGLKPKKKKGHSHAPGISVLFFLEWQRGGSYMFFSSLKMSKQKKPWEIAAFFRRKDETSHLLRASVVVSSAERSRRRLKVTRPNSRVPFLTHFQYRWFLGAKAEMTISVSGYLGEVIFWPLPTIPSEKIGGVLKYLLSYIFTPKTWEEDEPNLTIIFFRWVGGSIQPPTRPQKPRDKKPPAESGYNWKNVHDDLEAGRGPGDDGMNLDLLKKLILTTGSMEKWYICQHFSLTWFFTLMNLMGFFSPFSNHLIG